MSAASIEASSLGGLDPATLIDWPAGGYIGIHGTDRPDVIPRRISHGCIRLRNAELLRLARLTPVGTPLTVR